MPTNRRIHTTTNSTPAPKNSNSRKYPFSTKVLVANAILTAVVAGIIAIAGCPEQKAEKAEKTPAAEKADAGKSLTLVAVAPDTFEIAQEQRIHMHNSLKNFPSTSGSVAMVVEAGKKTLESNELSTIPETYEPLIDSFIEIYAHAGGDMIDSARAQAEMLPESKREAFMEEANLTIIALLLRPYAAWEGPKALENLDQLLSSPEFSEHAVDNFAFEYGLMREYSELTMNVRIRFPF